MKNLKELSQKKKITQIRLSITAEVSQETISAYESGKTLPSADTLIKLANFLDTSVDYLLDRTDNSTPLNLKRTNSSDELIQIFNKLNDNQKKDVLWYCKNIKSRESV